MKTGGKIDIKNFHDILGFISDRIFNTVAFNLFSCTKEWEKAQVLKIPFFKQ